METKKEVDDTTSLLYTNCIFNGRRTGKPNYMNFSYNLYFL